MSLVTEFKDFIRRGNVVDLAVGVIMGAAFGKIVNSLVSDVLMPPIGYFIGGKEFTKLQFTFPTIRIPDPLNPGQSLLQEPPTVKIGNFLQASFDFLIISICVFLLIKAMNTLVKKEAAVPPPPTETEKLLTEIRDLLKSK